MGARVSGAHVCPPPGGLGPWGRRVGCEQGCPLVPRPSCAGATRPPARMTAGAGRPTRSTAVSATAAGPASTVTCPASPARWPRGSKVSSPGFSVPTGHPTSEVRRCAAQGARWPLGRGAGASRSACCVPRRRQRDPLVPERGPLHECGQHTPLPLPGRLHGQLLRGAGGRVPTTPAATPVRWAPGPGAGVCVSGLSAAEGQALGWEPMRQGRLDSSGGLGDQERLLGGAVLWGHLQEGDPEKQGRVSPPPGSPTSILTPTSGSEPQLTRALTRVSTWVLLVGGLCEARG